MLYILMFAMIVPFLGLMIWNGVRGKGYKITVALPPKGNPHRLLVRLALFVYGLILFTLLALSKFNDAKRQGSSSSSIILTLVIFILAILVGIYIRSRRNRGL